MSWTIRNTDLRHRAPDFLSTIFCVGNGRICTRGTPSEARFEAYRGVFVSGLYARAPLGMMYYCGAPDWLTAFTIAPGDDIEWRVSSGKCTGSEWELDMREGVVRRTAIFSVGRGTVRVSEERFASFVHDSVMGQRYTVERVEGADQFDVVMGVDGQIRQHRAKYYQVGRFPAVNETGITMTDIERIDATADKLSVVLRIKTTRRQCATMARARAVEGVADDGVPFVADGIAGMRWTVPVDTNKAVFEKIAVVTGDLPGFEEAVTDGEKRFAELGGQSHDDAKRAHLDAIAEFWETGDIIIEGDERTQRAVRFAVWSTRASAPLDGGASSMAAKNLTGDWYRGAVFWDMDVFQLPMLSAIAPDRARNHELYRCLRLDDFRRLAAQDGYRGARVAGNTFERGIEDPPAFHGLGRMEIHVTFDVAWGMSHYYAITGDDEFMLQHGLEFMLETANFWSSRVSRDDDGSYHLRDICGPDELHKPVDDCAYMNHMIRDLLRRAMALIEKLRMVDAVRVDEVLALTKIDDAQLAQWQDVVDNLHVAMLDDKVIEQFADHSKLPVASPVAVKKNGMGSDQIGKQADTVLLFQTIPWAFSKDEIMANYRHYAPLCNQTSSLSLCTHALVAARLGLFRDARKYFELAAGVDLDDSMGNSDHGIHGAGEGGIWMAVVHGFGGLDVSPDRIAIEPHLPPWWKRLRYTVIVRGVPVTVDVRKGNFAVSVADSARGAVPLHVNGEDIRLNPGESREFKHSVEWREQGLDGVVFDADVAGLSGMDDLLDALKEAGIRCVAVDAGLVRKPKPHPQGFLVATHHLLVLPWNCIGIAADAEALEGIRRAGMLTVGVGDCGGDPDLSVASLDELSAEMLQKLSSGKDSPVNPYLERNLEIVQSEAKAKDYFKREM